MIPSLRRITSWAFRANRFNEEVRAIPEETPIAFTYNGSSYAVMMATPANLEDFAIGFSLTEKIINHPSDIERLEVLEMPLGIEVRVWLADELAQKLQRRRRYMAGPTGCGLCGLEDLEQAIRPLPRVMTSKVFDPDDIICAVNSMPPHQSLNRETRAVHAAAFWNSEKGLLVLCEDVGRHNALDKLCGSLAQSKISGQDGIIVLTSRVSVEMIQKAAIIAAPIVVAISAPTALAVRTAEEAGITIVAIARSDGFEVFTHRERLQGKAACHVA